MTKKIKLSDISLSKGKTNWSFLKSSEKSSDPSINAPEIKQFQLNQMRRVGKK